MNRGSDSWYATLYTGLPAGTYCNVYGDINADSAATCTGVVVNSNGQITETIKGLYGLAIHINAKKY